MDLNQFYAEIKDCQNCGLAKFRTQVVFGEGPPEAAIMFVGEAPGNHEDLQGKPFVGAAGRLLTELLKSIGMTREEVYIANVLKCRPPDNRNPLPGEIEACLPYLRRQIELVKPKVVCTLGNFATQVLLKKKVGITKVRGRYFEVDGYFVFPALHPAAALHQGGMIDALKEDFQNLKKFLALNLQPQPSLQQMGLL
jgi:uracil-DNA glycosylase